MAFSRGQAYFSEKGSLTRMNATDYAVSRLGGPPNTPPDLPPTGIAVLPDGLAVIYPRRGSPIFLYDSIQNGFEFFGRAVNNQPLPLAFLAYNDNNADFYFAGERGNQVFVVNGDSCNSGFCNGTVIAGQSGGLWSTLRPAKCHSCNRYIFTNL
ncbi:hypothetical protein DUNSADRAFT_11572 [Dunaliella salina]|uniref:Uncharacterized protein n=1 Tax=Dunaliella salina TaxID=3046 RepID=A0ABQ7GD53_DUNSA|nr:hypothetical protein DUNSADRAFT_11572 [Dunaliella salina]|eukprot:KAF5832534.1 hypothetical protein DUNSADRAFT_11572 [Dunaliella salina]